MNPYDAVRLEHFGSIWIGKVITKSKNNSFLTVQEFEWDAYEGRKFRLRLQSSSTWYIDFLFRL